MNYAHIRNPLTVIAIFAGITEAGGTFVLPFLKDSYNQLIYIYFLVGFPTYLVTIFFGVLIFKHVNLYAPSDYRNENLFAQAARSAVHAKLEEEVKEAAPPSPIEDTTDPNLNAPDSVFKQSHGDLLEIAPPAEGVAESTYSPANETGPTGEVPHSSSGKSILPEALRGYGASRNELLRQRVFTANAAALLQNEIEEGGVFVRNVSPPGKNDFVFDAVRSDTRGITIVEAKYIGRRRLELRAINQLLGATNAWYSSLNEPARVGFKLIIILVFDETTDEDRKYTVSMVNAAAAWVEYDVEIKTHDFQKLMPEWS